MKHPIGKDMPALGICTELDFIDSDKFRADILGHRLDGANPIFRLGRHNPLFACDQCHIERAAGFDDFVIHFFGQQPQRKAHHARAISKHPLNRIMRFTRVGWPQNCNDFRHQSYPFQPARPHAGLMLTACSRAICALLLSFGQDLSYLYDPN